MSDSCQKSCTLVPVGFTAQEVTPTLPVSGLSQLRTSDPGGYWLCTYRSSEEELRKAVYEERLDLELATVARTIFERLVKEERAGMVAESP